MYKVIIIIILLICSGFISASEVSFFYLSAEDIYKLKKNKSTFSINALKLLQAPEFLLSTILISNNFVNIACTLVSVSLISNIFSEYTNTLFYIFLQLIGITMMILIFGEIFPKIVSTRKYLFFVKFMVFPLFILKYLFYPLSWLLVNFTNIIKKRVKKKNPNDISIKEISEAISYASDLREEKEMLEDIVNSNSIDVKEIMTSRIDVFAIEYNSKFTKVLAQIIESGFSRIPVFIENLDNIKGILYIKDVIPYLNIEDKENFNWQKLIRQYYVIPENKKINELLTDFQQKKMHIAMIVDEYGGVCGLITLEDVLEEFIGEIHDETDTEEEIFYSKINDKTYEFNAKTSIIDFCKIVDADFMLFDDVKGESETLAGLILEINAAIPKNTTKVSVDKYDFIVTATDERRIKKIKVIIN